MSLFKKHTADAVVENDHDLDLDAVMRKYDRESATRVWEGVPKIVVRVILSIFSLYCIYMTLFSTALPETRLTLFLGFIIVVGFMFRRSTTFPGMTSC